MPDTLEGRLRLLCKGLLWFAAIAALLGIFLSNAGASNWRLDKELAYVQLTAGVLCLASAFSSTVFAGFGLLALNAYRKLCETADHMADLNRKLVAKAKPRT